MEDTNVGHKKIEGTVDRYKGMEVVDLKSLYGDEEQF
jgi:ADP-ribose pyrophosphatase YjhB (NUDIX family)